MKLKLFCLLLTIAITSCAKKVEKNAVVTDIGYKHWYSHYDKQLLTYKYTYKGQEYEAKESLWTYEAIYQIGDSALIEINTSNPQKSKLAGMRTYRRVNKEKYPNHFTRPIIESQSSDTINQ